METYPALLYSVLHYYVYNISLQFISLEIQPAVDPTIVTRHVTPSQPISDDIRSRRHLIFVNRFSNMLL
jgi:hypothetical protein